jgi:hypothetical protein
MTWDLPLYGVVIFALVSSIALPATAADSPKPPAKAAAAEPAAKPAPEAPAKAAAKPAAELPAKPVPEAPAKSDAKPAANESSTTDQPASLVPSPNGLFGQLRLGGGYVPANIEVGSDRYSAVSWGPSATVMLGYGWSRFVIGPELRWQAQVDADLLRSGQREASTHENQFSAAAAVTTTIGRGYYMQQLVTTSCLLKSSPSGSEYRRHRSGVLKTVRLQGELYPRTARPTKPNNAGNNPAFRVPARRV